MTSFLPSIDNLSYNVKDVYNMLIVPVFGHRVDESDDEEVLPQIADSASEPEDFGETFGQKKGRHKKLKTAPKVVKARKPTAILQFINKRGNKMISDFDIVSWHYFV